MLSAIIIELVKVSSSIILIRNILREANNFWVVLFKELTKSPSSILSPNVVHHNKMTPKL